MTRTAYLEGLHKQLSRSGDELSIEFRPFQGWYLCGEPRHFNDDGAEWMGANWREAEKFLRWLYPRRAA